MAGGDDGLSKRSIGLAFRIGIEMVAAMIVGVGGGLIGPMRQRWEQILTKAEQEAPRARAEAEANGGRAMADLRTRAEVSPAARTDELPLHRDGGGAYAHDGGPTHAR